MFISTNSDGQKLENLRKKRREKFFKNNSLSVPNVSDSLKFSLHPFYFLFLFSLDVGPTCPFISLFGPFQSRNNLFCSGFNFIYPN